MNSFYRIGLEQDDSPAYRRSLHRTVLLALERGERHIVIDCLSWSRLDLMVLSTLISCAAACEVHGAEFAIENLAGELQSGIEALRVSGRLGLVGSGVQSAVA